MSTQETCARGCSGGPKLIFACSGVADVGAIADQAARKLTREGAGAMYCLAGLGARIPGFVKHTQAASTILAIDGCPHDCARRILEQSGFTSFQHLQLADIGFEKGKSPVTNAAIDAVATRAAELL